jgi:hypothetical protein
MNTRLSAQIELLLGQDPDVTPREELLARLNLEREGHMALDIPVTTGNRKLWARVWEAQHEAPVYA